MTCTDGFGPGWPQCGKHPLLLSLSCCSCLQVESLQNLLGQQEATAAAQVSMLQQQVSEQSSQAQQLQQHLQQQAAAAVADLQDAHAGFTKFTGTLEAELAEARNVHQLKMAELSSLLSAAREERGQLASALQLLTNSIGGSAPMAAANATRSIAPNAADVEAVAGQCITASVAVAKQLHMDIASLTAARKELHSQVSQLKKQLVSSEQQHQQHSELLQEQLGKLQGHLAAAQAERKELENQVQDKAAAVASTKAHAAELARQVGTHELSPGRHLAETTTLWLLLSPVDCSVV